MLYGNGLHARYQFHTCPAIYDIHGSDVCFSKLRKECNLLEMSVG